MANMAFFGWRGECIAEMPTPRGEERSVKSAGRCRSPVPFMDNDVWVLVPLFGVNLLYTVSEHP